MPLTLSERESEEIGQLRQAGVLQPVNRTMMDKARNGSIFMPCPDGHHFHDLYRHHLHLCGHEEEDAELMHHPLSLNGGALLLPENSPLRLLENGTYGPDDEVLLRHLAGAVALKRPHTVILYAHAPCAMARQHQLSVMDEFRLLVEAKQRVRGVVNPLGVQDVRAWFHVFQQNGQRKTYHFRRAQWDTFCGRRVAA